MSLITPDFGLFFWMVLAFGFVLLIMKKFAWKPILKGLSARESAIAEALDKVRAAQQEVAELEERHVAMMAQAQAERDQLVAEARSTREAILSQAREEARRQAEVFIAEARERMRQEDLEQRKRLRSEVTQVAILAAERLLRQHLSSEERQQEHLDRILDEVLAK